MSWPFLMLRRQSIQSANNWGVLYIRTANESWEKFSYSYELPWLPDAEGKSRNNVSRIAIGSYEMKVREDGGSRAEGKKGWRLELVGTGHRTLIQVHRAHRKMIIEGCILPVHFNEFTPDGPAKGDWIILTKSIALMDKMKERYDELKVGSEGKATLLITANLPASVPSLVQYA